MFFLKVQMDLADVLTRKLVSQYSTLCQCMDAWQLYSLLVTGGTLVVQQDVLNPSSIVRIYLITTQMYFKKSGKVDIHNYCFHLSYMVILENKYFHPLMFTSLRCKCLHKMMNSLHVPHDNYEYYCV